MRFLTITCNPAADVTYLLDALRPGEINRVDQVLPGPGGKGNNVARILAALGRAPVATGLAGGHTGRRIVAGLAAEGIRPAFIDVANESRTCLTIVERATGRTTEIREPGQPVAEPDAQRLLDRVRALAAETDAAVISGSMLPGLPAGFYRSLTDILKGAGVYVALDAGGDALRLGLPAGPDLIKPNLEELAGLIGPVDAERAAEAARRRLLGPMLDPSATILLSLGAAGAALIRRNGIVQATPPPVTTGNTVGAGDALLAGYLDAWARGANDEDAIADAVAVGTAAVLQTAVGTIDTQQVEHLRPRVQTRVVVGEPVAGSTRAEPMTSAWAPAPVGSAKEW